MATGHCLGNGQQSHMLLTIPRVSLASLLRGEPHLTPVHCGSAGRITAITSRCLWLWFWFWARDPSKRRAKEKRRTQLHHGDSRAAEGRGRLMRQGFPTIRALQRLCNNLHYFSNEKPSLLPILSHSAFHGSDFFPANDDCLPTHRRARNAGGCWGTI